jgi:hypothetical protein
MERQGLQYASPIKAEDAFNVGTPSPSAAEIAVAVSDVLCKRQSHLVSVWSAAESHAERAEIARNPKTVRAWKRWKLHA